MTHPSTKPSAKTKKLMKELRDFALDFPGTKEDFPWGHSALKAGKKAFVFLFADASTLNLSVKLKKSHLEALELPFAEPTGYGLGKHGWMSASFAPNDQVPIGLLEQWIEESYRLIAPKTLVKQLDAPAPQTAKPKTTRAKTKKRKTAPKVSSPAAS